MRGRCHSSLPGNDRSAWNGTNVPLHRWPSFAFRRVEMAARRLKSRPLPLYCFVRDVDFSFQNHERQSEESSSNATVRVSHRKAAADQQLAATGQRRAKTRLSPLSRECRNHPISVRDRPTKCRVAPSFCRSTGSRPEFSPL